MAGAEDTTTPRTRRKLRGLLIGSLALNLVLVGLFVGAGLRHGAPSHATVRADILVRVLEGEDRRAIGRAVKDAQGGGRAAFWAAQKAALQAVSAALVAEPFDPARLEAALAQKSAHLRRTRDVAEGAILARLAEMGPEARAAVAARLEAALERGPKVFKKKNRSD